jgi:hypothetical protein
VSDDEKRVGLLENLIIVAHRQMSRMPTEEPYYATLKSRVAEYQREYKELTGEIYTGTTRSKSLGGMF